MIRGAAVVGSVSLFPVVDESEEKVLIHIDGIDDVLIISLDKLKNLFAASGEMLEMIDRNKPI